MTTYQLPYIGIPFYLNTDWTVFIETRSGLWEISPLSSWWLQSPVLCAKCHYCLPYSVVPILVQLKIHSSKIFVRTWTLLDLLYRNLVGPCAIFLYGIPSLNSSYFISLCIHHNLFLQLLITVFRSSSPICRLKIFLIFILLVYISFSASLKPVKESVIHMRRR